MLGELRALSEEQGPGQGLSYLPKDRLRLEDLC